MQDRSNQFSHAWYDVKINTTHCDSLGEKVIDALSKIFIKFTSMTLILFKVGGYKQPRTVES